MNYRDKTKLKVDIMQPGYHNDAILKMVANHNVGLKHISPIDIAGYCKCRAAEYPDLFSKTTAELTDGNTCVSISEDCGLSFTLTIRAVLLIDEIKKQENQKLENS